ncbi:MAG: flagellar hook-basal body complex protein [Planctomycetota bacterium]|nr:flagellar hook-basal body complex protein [Planctomycetota bacterium]
MALTSTLFTGLSGLDVNQTRLNVVGNNIANVNTVAFKSSSVIFSPQFYVTDQPGSAPNGNFGGTNPSQHGLGSQVAAITTDFTPGTIDTTGVSTDMAINGNGFFVVNSSKGQQYTRDGSFILNSSNELVSTTGAFVQGYGSDSSGNIINGALQNVTIPIGQATESKATSNATLQGNLNAAGPAAAGATILTSQAMGTVGGTAPTATTPLVNLRSTGATPAALVAAGDTLTLKGTRGSRDLPSNSLAISPTTTVGDLQNFVNESLGIDTSVLEAGNPTPGATLQTTGTTAQLTIVGNTGADNALTLGSSGISDSSGTSPFQITAGTDGAFTNNPVGESTHTTISGYDSLGSPITVDVTAVLESKADSGNTWRFYASSADNKGGAGPVVGNGTLTFDSSGALKSSTGTTITISRTGTGAGTPVVMNLDFSKTTSLASTTSQVVMSNQDGEPIGTLASFSVGASGAISGSFTNGLTKTLGQVALATFHNPQGLVNQGGNFYQAGANSGVAIIGSPGVDGAGNVQSGALEGSNVDISKEFINMIIASTGFSASSRVITTSNQLITELLNSTR